ncbi:protein kinase domain-containing protein [Alkalinema pantanalense CENA528]|uniref:serine/threonine protein kinase n=1 Tax=Alkalinema pantanalense TaxID=1620705 RepID=UPI003D6F2503
MQLGDTQVGGVQRSGIQLNAGTTLQNGKYLLNHPLDGQGIGLTYRATVSATGQIVAIKTFNPTLQSHPKYAQLRQRFLDRSRLLAASQHPSLVRVLDIFSEAEQPFVVMEYISGSTLADLFASQATLSPKAVLQALCQATAALHVAHSHHLVHGNLHPRQLIQRSGSNAIVLVGFSTGLIPAASKSLDPARSLYWAPEMLTQGATPQTDLYSIAAMLYHALSNHPPLSVASGDLAEKFPLLPLLPPAVQKVLRYAMAADPKQRVQTAEALLHLFGGGSAGSSQAENPERSQPRTQPSLTTPTLAPSPLVSASAAPLMAVTVAPTEPTLVPPVASSEAMPMVSDRPEVIASAAPAVTPSSSSIILPRLPQTPSSAAEPIAQPPAFPDAPARPPLAPALYRHEPLAEPDPTPDPSNLDSASPESAPDLGYSSEASQSSTPKSSMLIVPKYPKRAFVLIGAIAAAFGLSFGLALRFSAGQRPGSSLFHAGQSFPQREWKGSVEAIENSDEIPSETPSTTNRSPNSGSTSPTSEVNDFPEPIESPLPRREIPFNPVPSVDSTAPDARDETSPPPPAKPSRRQPEDAPPAASSSEPPAKAPLVEPDLPPAAPSPASSKPPRGADPLPPAASPKALTKSADPLPPEPTP